MKLVRHLGATALAAGLLGSCTSAGSPEPAMSAGSVANERVSTDDALPREFDSTFPLPAGRRVLYSAVSSIGVVVYFDSDESSVEIKRFLFPALSDRGWKLNVCREAGGGTEPVTTIVASRGSTVASVVVGYSPENASRIGGKRYAFFVSIATNAQAPATSAQPC